MPVSVERIASSRPSKEFIDLPYALYRDDPNWVAPLRMDEKTKLDDTKHPFWGHAERAIFLARRLGADRGNGKGGTGRTVGRIVAIADRLWEAAHGEKAAYWGWFECANDAEAARALFEAASSWARAQGCVRLIGPMSPSPSDLVGLQISGFDGPPVIMMPYNPPYYDLLVTGAGNSKWKDLVAWLLDSPEIPERLERIMPRIEAKGGFTLRKLDMRRYDKEVQTFAELYNRFETVNSIYTPMTPPEVVQLAKDLKPAIDPDIVFFVEVDGKPVAASLGIPDANVGLKEARGRLLPFGIFKILAARKRIHLVRVLSMGVDKDYRNRGIDLAMYYYSYKFGVPKGYYGAEMSWIEEDNVAMTNTAIKLGGKPYRTYRMYERKL
jgi:GNAT superfamily N-acetyltransferase